MARAQELSPLIELDKLSFDSHLQPIILRRRFKFCSLNPDGRLREGVRTTCPNLTVQIL